MNIVVLVKQVPDTETKIRVTGDANGIEKGDIKWIVSPYDEFAIEEALQLKKAIGSGTVTAVCLGPDRVVDALRTALAMGADNAIHVQAEESLTDSYLVSKALSEALKKESYDIVLAGKQAIDDDQSAVHGLVGEFLDIPSVSLASHVEFKDGKVITHREVEGGTLMTIEMATPCLVATTKTENSPRYASLPGIMKAKKKEVKKYSFADLGLEGESPATSESEYSLPPERSAGKVLSGEVPAQVSELVRLLREEAKVL